MSRRRRRRSRPRALRLVIFLALVLGGSVAWWLIAREDPELNPPAADGARPEAVRSERVRLAPADVEPLVLPPLDSSDVLVRSMVATLSEHPRLATWLVTDDLVRRFVRAVVDVASGKSPAEPLDMLAPQGPFEVVELPTRTVIAPQSYRRYDVFVNVFTSLDDDAAVRYYLQLHPLMERAFDDLGIPDVSFDEVLERAMDQLLAAPIPDGEVTVQPNATLFRFESPQLEALTGAEKQLIRMGPENARRFQQSLATKKRAIFGG